MPRVGDRVAEIGFDVCPVGHVDFFDGCLINTHNATGLRRPWKSASVTFPLCRELDACFRRRKLFAGVFLVEGGLAVPDQELLSLAMELRARAEEMLARAETFHDATRKRGG
jgi:hypothetical protein